MRLARVVATALLVFGCGGTPPTATVVTRTQPPTSAVPAPPTASPVPTPSPAITPTIAPSLAPTAPAGFKLVNTSTFRVAVPTTWSVQVDPSAQQLLKAASPLGGSTFNVYTTTLDGKGLKQFVDDKNTQLAGIWNTTVTQTETTIDSVPALRGDAVETFPATIAHVLFDVELPTKQGTVLEIALDTEGTAPDRALDTILATFTFARK